ncbi:4215_t:CDS:2 [Gigaspora rosea]|nr:4215_t:CDS:2 [Gigaspora rosea]
MILENFFYVTYMLTADENEFREKIFYKYLSSFPHYLTDISHINNKKNQDLNKGQIRIGVPSKFENQLSRK